jgi:hypothetical protein
VRLLQGLGSNDCKSEGCGIACFAMSTFGVGDSGYFDWARTSHHTSRATCLLNVRAFAFERDRFG